MLHVTGATVPAPQKYAGGQSYAAEGVGQYLPGGQASAVTVLRGGSCRLGWGWGGGGVAGRGARAGDSGRLAGL